MDEIREEMEMRGCNCECEGTCEGCHCTEPCDATPETPIYPDHVVLSFSGGLDSTSLLMYYLAQGKPVTAVSFKYGQKHAIELKRAAKIVKFLQKLGFQVDHKIVDLTSAFQASASSLTGHGDIPEGNYNEENQKSTVVENRNVIFSSIVYGMALGISKTQGIDVCIAQGVHAGDHTIYPDCRPESVEMAKKLYAISNWGSERIVFETPFVNFTKGEVLRAGIDAMKALHFNKPKINKIYALSSSCYNPAEDGTPCGKCGTCRERAEAFEENNMKDPALK